MPGTQVRIEGNYFCLQSVIDDMDPFACHVMGSVLFGASVTSASQYTDTLITAEVPSAPPGALRVSVLVGARSSNALEFVVE